MDFFYKKDFLLNFYFDKHPILKLGSLEKLSYMALIERCFSENKEQENNFPENIIKLYKKYFVLSSDSIKFSEISKFSLDELVNNFRGTDIGPKYLFALILTDCLFINCFFDEEKGKRILTYIKSLSKRFIINFTESLYDNIFKAFYAIEKTDEFEKSFSKFLDIYDVIWKNRRFLNLSVERIIFTGNMSAGKSTLLNAIVGKRVSKAQNEACTSENRYIYEKLENGFNSVISDSFIDLDVPEDDLINCTEDKEVHIALHFRKLVENKDNRFIFVDTPGVNSSLNEEHKEITYSAIEKETDIIEHLNNASSIDEFFNSMPYKRMIYILDSGNIGRNDDFIHLQYVKEHYSNFAGGVMFLVNRVDDFNAKDDSIEETLEAVKNDLKKIGFIPQQCENVFPISAYAGYLAKRKLFGYDFNEDEQEAWNIYLRKFKKEYFQFDKFWDNSDNLSGYLKGIEDKDICNVFLHSGLLNLEDAIFNPNLWKRINETFQQTSFVLQEMQRFQEEQDKAFGKLEEALDEYEKEIKESNRANFESVCNKIEVLSDEKVFGFEFRALLPQKIKEKIVNISQLALSKLQKFEDEKREIENEFDKFLFRIDNISTADELIDLMQNSKSFLEKSAYEGIVNDSIREKAILVSLKIQEKKNLFF